MTLVKRLQNRICRRFADVEIKKLSLDGFGIVYGYLKLLMHGKY